MENEGLVKKILKKQKEYTVWGYMALSCFLPLLATQIGQNYASSHDAGRETLALYGDVTLLILAVMIVFATMDEWRRGRKALAAVGAVFTAVAFGACIWGVSLTWPNWVAFFS